MADSTRVRAAVITGAGSGIGQATAVALARVGFRVALVGRDATKLEATRALVGRDDTLVESVDVADLGAVSGMAERVLAATGGRLEVLVCNAGTNVRDRALAKLSPADWNLMIATNLTGAFHLVHAFLPAMREQKDGLIVSDLLDRRTPGKLAGWCGLLGVEVLAKPRSGSAWGWEEGKNGIRSSVIYPGEVNTPILANRPIAVPQERKDAILQAEDVAAAVRFLVELPARAHVPELVIKPTVDAWA